MSRPRTGNLKPPRSPGDLYGVEFSLHGERHYVSFPGSEGWDDVRAVDEQRYLMEKVNRGEWEPERAAPAPATTRVPLYRDFAAESLARRIRKLEGTTDASAPPRSSTTCRSAWRASARCRSNRSTRTPSRTW
jgi:hypothetical protein